MSDDKNRSKHYSPEEKSVFLQIIDRYKHVVECKKSNVSTLRDKESAWTKICEEFNNSALMMQERSVQQLKKLWTNMKHVHRDQITIEKQSRLATGGGPEIPSTEVDPEIAAIVPSLMANAPIFFSSNMNDTEIECGRQMVREINGNNDDSDVIALENNPSTSETSTKKRKCLETEEGLKILRIKSIMKHEERMASMREDHLKQIHALEIRAALAKAELAEMILKKEK